MERRDTNNFEASYKDRELDTYKAMNSPTEWPATEVILESLNEKWYSCYIQNRK